MGLGQAAVQLTLELWRRGYFRGIESVVEMGSEEIHLTQSRFERLLTAAAVPGYSASDFPDIANYPGQPRTSARHLYTLLGAKRYACVDLNGEFGAIPHDLNTPFDDPGHLSAYDLVTDHGTCEHAFNIAECYRTMHRLCRTNGLILAVQQIYGGNGFYNFDRSFFEGIAAANSYQILYASFVVTPTASEDQFHVPIGSAMLEVIDYAKLAYLGAAYVFRKLGDADFRFPYQDEVFGDVDHHYGYALDFSMDPPSRTYVPMFSLASIPPEVLLAAAGSRRRSDLIRRVVSNPVTRGPALALRRLLKGARR